LRSGAVCPRWSLAICDTCDDESLFCFKAKENIREMKKELDSILQTAEKAFTVELLKIPVAIRKMKRKDLLSKCAWPSICGGCGRRYSVVCPWLRGENLQAG